MEVKAGLGIRDPSCCPTADGIHIAGNRLALDFTESTTNRAREEGVAATSLSWSSSIMRLIHNGTHDWLHKCLRHMPSEHHLKANISLAAPLLKDISEMLAPIRAHQKCTAAVSANNTSTQRHLRLRSRPAANHARETRHRKAAPWLHVLKPAWTLAHAACEQCR